MLKKFSRAQIVAAWCAVVIVFGVCSVAAGAAITISNGGLLLVTCLVPSAVMFLIWRGPPPLTVAELLYAVNRPSKDGRR